MKTLAVVVGIDNYYGSAKLDNAVSDATAINDVFIRLGYDVIFKTNCNAADCTILLDEFSERIQNFEASIFYFAGHGFQVDGENFLASTDCQVETPTKFHCTRTCIRLSEILDIHKKSINNINIVIIDACRRSFDRGATNTFTPIHAPRGTLIAFSTSPNEGAKDKGIEGHSIYTGALLKYIGRERLSVEELFKKVRKTVSNLTNGAQTTWEHTSLIGDFYFNVGQLVYSLEVPYDEFVVKDNKYKITSDKISHIIGELKSQNWDRQNEAMDEFERIKPNTMDKNQQFIIGRNILQASGAAYHAINFLAEASENLKRYNRNGENHVLNGILFEIYFNSNGEFRQGQFKQFQIDKIMALRHMREFKSSFDFLAQLLQPYKDQLFYVPSETDQIIDVDVLVLNKLSSGSLPNDAAYQEIEKIAVHSKNITNEMRQYDLIGADEMKLKIALSNFLVAPVDLIQINSNVELTYITFIRQEQDLSLY